MVSGRQQQTQDSQGQTQCFFPCAAIILKQRKSIEDEPGAKENFLGSLLWAQIYSYAVWR